jgi:N-acetylneuraminate synthase
MLAIAKGATVFEKHVGLPTAKYALNAYSANPEEVRRWLEAARRALVICGDDAWPAATPAEADSLASLRRGVFLTQNVAAGEQVENDAVSFAFPPAPGQITANQWSKYVRHIARQPLATGTPLMAETLDIRDERQQVLEIVTRVRQMLRDGGILAPGQSELEISHHYGMEKFHEYGLTMMTVVNREYCKKLLVLLPGQTHPEQYHRQKEETFVILHGTMTLWLDGAAREVARGDVITVGRGVKHRFFSSEGVVFEEISSTHHKDDSFYTDPAIAANTHRKTILTYWL